MIRVLVAEDSATTREYLAWLLGEEPGIEVAGTACDGAEAVEQAERLRPDLILMDINMPRLDGFQAARRIMERAPAPIVLISASTEQVEVARTFAALAAGALAVLDKPAGPGDPRAGEMAHRLRETVRLMAEVKVVRRWPRRIGREAAAAAPRERARRGIRLVALGASTGGPPVVEQILKALPRDLCAPILLVQHIAPGFVAGLAGWLRQSTRHPVKLAEHGELAEPGAVYVAGDGAQLGITRHGRIVLTPGARRDGFCPSASHLFESAADAFGHAALGALLTGMGQDGAVGLRRLREAGGTTVAQDEATSVVFGMPQAAIRLGAAEQVLAPAAIARLIAAMARGGSRG